MTLGLSFIYMIRVYLLQVSGAGPGLVCRWEGCFSFCLWGRSVLVCSGDFLVLLGWASWGLGTKAPSVLATSFPECVRQAGV